MFKKWLPSKKEHQLDREIVVVSGLPRSGTSMMMKMLAAGGMQLLTDHVRAADDDNPGGYYEFEPVKGLKDGLTDWLPQAMGKAVKVIATLLPHLPAHYRYRVVFMQRLMPEILASQRRMLVARGKDPDAVRDEDMARIFQAHLEKVQTWMQAQPNLHYLEVSYNHLLENPLPELHRINEFFDQRLDVPSMASVIDSNLYRQRAGE